MTTLESLARVIALARHGTDAMWANYMESAKAVEKMMSKVKALEWREARVSDRWQRETADTILGVYEALEWSDGTFGGSVPNADRDEPNEEFSSPNLEAAKATCQANFEQRILSAWEMK